MRRSLRFVAAAAVAAATLAVAPAAFAAPPSTSFAVTGFEYAFTPTVGFFAGTATGNAGDTGVWNTYVVHDPLGSEPTYINGGSFGMRTRSTDGTTDRVRGAYVHHGGTITTIDPGANCTNQQYLVIGALEDVETSTTTDGTGLFTALLTHHRTRFFGRCVTYSATVVGTASFTYATLST